MMNTTRAWSTTLIPGVRVRHTGDNGMGTVLVVHANGVNVLWDNGAPEDEGDADGRFERQYYRPDYLELVILERTQLHP